MKKRIAALLICALLCLLPVRAAEPVALDRAASLTVSYHDGAFPLSGAQFSAYHVAAFEEDGTLTPTADFAAVLDEVDSESAALAATLQSHVLRNSRSIKPAASGKTDARGELTFADLTPGLYLITGRRLHTAGSFYDVSPFLVQLPMANDDGTWSYDVTVDPKNATQPTPSEGSTVTRKVLKIWDDAGYEEKRPPQITVQLLREDGTVYDTVTLSEENNWRYTWENLDAQQRWFVAEQTPSGYRMEQTQEGVTFVITNHYAPDNPDNPDTPDNPDNPDTPDNPDNPDSPDTPDTPDSPDNPDSPGTSDTPILPQTGQLWWPVPLLLAAGLALVSFGLARRRHGDA